MKLFYLVEQLNVKEIPDIREWKIKREKRDDEVEQIGSIFIKRTNAIH